MYAQQLMDIQLSLQPETRQKKLKNKN